MEGVISLGIYDHDAHLVRVLHRAATGDEFVAALDGYITHWDGLDDSGKPLPSGRYAASGFMVGDVAVQPVPLPAGRSANSLKSALPTLTVPGSKAFAPREKIHVSLVANPLDQDRAGSADLTVAFDSHGSWIELADGLPLKRISSTPNLKWIACGRASPGEPIIVFQSDGAAIQEFAVTGVSNMMAFDCGPFDFSGPAQ